MPNRLRHLAADRRGATAMEYALIVALIAMACIGAFTSIAAGTTSMWSGISGEVADANG